MVYEANARLRDPVYGCAGAICQLQKQVNELQEQLAKSQAQLVNVQCQNANLMTLICLEMSQSSSPTTTSSPVLFDHQPHYDNLIINGFLDENSIGFLSDQPLWTWPRYRTNLLRTMHVFRFSLTKLEYIYYIYIYMMINWKGCMHIVIYRG